MKKYSFVIDVARCENCNNCFLSCKDEHCGNDWQPYSLSQPLHGQRWMNILRKERGQFPLIDVAYLPKPCMHCDDAPCVEAAENGAVFKRPDGIVIIDPVKARGQKKIVTACPYGTIWWNEDEQVAQKCSFCVHLLNKGWKKPRCVQACPTGALSILYVEDEELAEVIAGGEFETLDAKGTSARPRCFYKNLHRYNKCMITGSVATSENDISECAIGVTIRLYRNGDIAGEQISDEFGDFTFDGLLEGSGKYDIEVVSSGKTVLKIAITLQKSISVGTLWV